MKKIVVKIFFAVVILLIIVLFVFGERFSGAWAVYNALTDFTENIHQGSPELNILIKGNWSAKGKADSLTAEIHYRKDEQFLADVRVKGNRYLVQSDRQNTQVEISQAGILVSATGTDQKNFDLFLLIGEIFGNHPRLEPILSMNWFERVGIAMWSFIKCDFRKEKWRNADYQVIELPQHLTKAQLSIWRKIGDEKNELRIVAQSIAKPLKVEIVAEKISPAKREIISEARHKIVVAREELNTAIYRGAIRAAGIMVENVIRPATDGVERTWGKGKLTYVEGNRVLVAKGTHREIGEAHGALLSKEIRKMVDATLYTITWVYAMESRKWFIDDIRKAYQRLEPFIPQKYQEEMAGLAETSGISLEEIRLTNVFPALFHCSGFALWGKATVGGKLYHGRVLDYMTELGLQNCAVVYIIKPTGSNAFANIGFAGFIGSVSGMNDQQVAIGEMGGGGVGDWDGMPMALLVREGLERANSLTEAVAIFRDTPRTCEYFYVISDGKIPDARGLSTTPSRFEIVEPNKFHPLLPHPLKDVVLMSAGDRYEKLYQRVKENYGKIDGEKAIRLMDRPVAMKSNLHNVLFLPQSLEFWVANAGAHTPACDEIYTHYSMSELLALVEE